MLLHQIYSCILHYYMCLVVMCYRSNFMLTLSSFLAHLSGAYAIWMSLALSVISRVFAVSTI